MTYAKDFSTAQLNYRQSEQTRPELPLRLRLFLLSLAALAISFGVLLAYLLH